MGLAQDLRYALRALRKTPAFTTVAALTLALGIGANTAMFTVLNAVLLRPLPFRAPQQLVTLWTELPRQALREGRSSYRDVEEWRAQSRTLQDVAVFDPVSLRLNIAGEVEQIGVVRASPNYFSVLGLQAARGRLFSAEDADQRRRVVVISHRFWQGRLGGGDVIGRTIEIDGARSEVVGVLPESFELGGEAPPLWEPHTLFADWDARRGPQGGASWFALGRLRDGVTLQQAQSELSTIAGRLDEVRPATDRGRGVNVVQFSVVDPASRFALWTLMGAVVFVLLIGVTNITSLVLARSASREREIALRTALGATSARVVRQLLAESLTLAVLSAIVGVIVAIAALPVLTALAPADVRIPDDLAPDARVLLFTLGISVAAGVIVGLLPAFTSGRRSLNPLLSQSGKGTSSAAITRLTRQALVAAEFALAIVLLVGAGLFTRSLLRAQEVDSGFTADRVLSMNLSLPQLGTSAQRTEYYHQVLENVTATPGVESAAVIGDLFISGAPEQVITVEGGAQNGSSRVRLRRDEVSDAFFSTLQIPLRRGRWFTADDRADSPRVAVINETMARRMWPSQDPVGRRFRLGTAPQAPWFTVVGVVADMRRQGPELEPVAQMFEPLAQNPSRLAVLLIRTASDPSGMAPSVRAAIRRFDPQAFTYSLTTLDARLDAFQAERRFQTTLLMTFSLLALVLAAIGIYGVIQYSITMRTREIGVRMAVGAQRRDIFRMVVGEGLALSVAGMIVGLVGTLWLGRLTSSLLFGVTATDPLTYAVVSLGLAAVALAACYFPARRASRVDPLTALRYE